jgi:hypothetical protein
MNYSVVQNIITKPTPEDLAEAFRVLPDLIDIDAVSLSNDAYGIIADGLTQEQSVCLANALNARGVSTQSVANTKFPVLTPAKQVRQLTCNPDMILIHDALGRTTPIPWDQVVLVAAGFVTEPKFRRIEKQRVVMRRSGMDGGVYPIFLTDVAKKEELLSKLVLELYLRTGPVRICIYGDEFQYNYLGERLQLRYMDNFALLVQDITALAQNAILNRGAESLMDNSTVTFHYPTRHAFDEETVWLLWANSQTKSSSQ